MITVAADTMDANPCRCVPRNDIARCRSSTTDRIVTGSSRNQDSTSGVPQTGSPCCIGSDVVTFNDVRIGAYTCDKDAGVSITTDHIAIDRVCRGTALNQDTSI